MANECYKWSLLMQADSHSNFTVSREQNRYDGIIPFSHQNRIIYFHPLHAFYSWLLGVINIFQLGLSLVSWSPCSSDCQQKGQLSFSQRRMSLLEPHLLQCVHQNLHNSRGKCQYTESMAIRRVGHYSCLPRCDVEELAENELPADRRNKWWIMLFSFLHTHRNC